MTSRYRSKGKCAKPTTNTQMKSIDPVRCTPHERLRKSSCCHCHACPIHHLDHMLVWKSDHFKNGLDHELLLFAHRWGLEYPRHSASLLWIMRTISIPKNWVNSQPIYQSTIHRFNLLIFGMFGCEMKSRKGSSIGGFVYHIPRKSNCCIALKIKCTRCEEMASLFEFLLYWNLATFQGCLEGCSTHTAAASFR